VPYGNAESEARDGRRAGVYGEIESAAPSAICIYAIQETASARAEVEAAGLVLDAESTMLANKDDPHSSKVFDPSIKGETDRFAYRFVKP
jgi:predicted methyltransferase